MSKLKLIFYSFPLFFSLFLFSLFCFRSSNSNFKSISFFFAKLILFKKKSPNIETNWMLNTSDDLTRTKNRSEKFEKKYSYFFDRIAIPHVCTCLDEIFIVQEISRISRISWKIESKNSLTFQIRSYQTICDLGLFDSFR